MVKTRGVVHAFGDGKWRARVLGQNKRRHDLRVRYKGALRDVEFRTGVALSETPEFRTPMCGVEIVKHRALLKPIYRFMKNTHSILRGCVEKIAVVTNARSKYFQLFYNQTPFRIKIFWDSGVKLFFHFVI